MKRAELHRGVTGLLAALVLIAQSSPGAAQATPDLPAAADVTARYVEAIGGREAILSHESRYMKLFFKGPFNEADNIVYAAKPNKIYARWEREGVVRSQWGFDGEVGWQIEPGLGPRILMGWELDRAREGADFYADLYDSENFATMETVELTEFENRQCYKLRLVWKSGREAFEYFDAETGLKLGSVGKSYNGNEAFERIRVLADYEEFGGVLIPTKRIWRYEGWPHEQVLTITALELDNVPDTVFALPAELESGSWPVADAIAEAMELKPGQVVADIGSGIGVLSVELARRVGPMGQVLATEILPDMLPEIRAQAAYEGLRNVTPVLADQSFTGLPAACCDGILLRFVYHEFTEPDVMNAEMLRALKPDGRVVVIDALAEGDSLVNGRGNHTILPDVLIEEMVASGFELVEREDKWDGEDNRFAAVFKRPPVNQ